MVEVEQKLSVATAASGDLQKDSFISQLLRLVADLYDKDSFSDITIKYGTQKRRGHKFVLAARSSVWLELDMTNREEIEMEGVSNEVGSAIIKWLYTDRADIKNDEKFIIELVKAANRYRLDALKNRCEKILMSSITVSNCIKFYQTAEDIGANALRQYCAEIIASHWNDLKTEDFVEMSAPLLYDMFKAKSQFPLHFAIRHHREDVVFLFLIEFNAQLPAKIDEREVTTNQLPLEIALNEKQESIARTLVNHGCNINSPDHDGFTLLHRAVEHGDEFGAMFLIEHGANVKSVTIAERDTPLHLSAKYKPWSSSSRSSSADQGKDWSKMTSSEGMARVCKQLVDKGTDPNAQNASGLTPLHLALSHDNADVFDVLLDHPSLDLERRDKDGHVVLWFAILSSKVNLDDDSETSYAAKLVKRGSSADAVNPLSGDSLLHLAAFSGNEAAGLFLLAQGAQPNHANKKGETPLHASSLKGHASLVKELLKRGANSNARTVATDYLRNVANERREKRVRNLKEIRTRIVSLEKSKAMKRIKELKEKQQKSTNAVSSQQKNTEIKQKDLSLDLRSPTTDELEPSKKDLYADNNPFLNSPVDSAYGEGNPFAAEGNDFMNEIQAATSAAMALSGRTMTRNDSDYNVKTTGATSDSNPTILTYDGRIDLNAVQSPTAIEKFDYDAMTISDLEIESDLDNDVITECWDRTPMHVAVTEKNESVLRCFVEYKDNASHGGGMGRIPIFPDFNLQDSEGQTVLEIALWKKQYQVARSLLDAEADINHIGVDGKTLLHKAITRKDVDSSLFLIDNGADINRLTKENMSPLLMAIRLQLEPVVDSLCKRGADENSSDENGNTPLWIALKSRQMDIATTLVKNGCDTTAWNLGINNCTWSLLHRAIYELDGEAACFLIRNGCEINSARKPGPGGYGGVEAYDGLTPLHLACAAGQDEVVQCLVENSVKINAQDSEQRTPLHIAITSHNPIVTRLLLSHPELDLTLKDRTGQTAFAVAMNAKDNEAAAAILSREPSSAEQFDSRGRNYLHTAILNSDVDGVLFLISIEVDVGSPIQDGSLRTPLHLAIPSGSEVIVRHLIWAGANINATDKSRRTPIHVAAIEDKATLISVLLQGGADPNLLDSSQNNALHLACQNGNLNSIRVLLTESNANAEAQNGRGQNSLHCLAIYNKDNAAAIFELFRQNRPDMNINALDAEDNSALFLAYTSGAVGLCCALLRSGAKLGTINKQGVSLFNAPVATKKLLFRLLDLLNAEPAWLDGPNCHECGVKFNVTTRKHHCRHCGRLLCAKCCNKQMPILKYELTKPVRVCEICFDFLTLGPM
eukprot:gene15608-6884_t